MSGSGQDPRSHDPATRETIPPGGKIESQGKSTAAATSAIPGKLGRYSILRCLGTGGMGAVYLAQDDQLDRQVALKIPTAQVAGSPKQLERLYREARSAATLSHPNICSVYDVGEIDGRHYISMAYVDGRPLSDFVRRDKLLPERQVVAVVRRIALALQHAHEQGVIHRDLKPSNIMIDPRRQPIVMDFGLARQVGSDSDIRLTRQGAILGSPAYMSPEQVEGDIESIGPASDIYSLGVLLYELLTAELPFAGSMASVMGQILTRDPIPPSELRPDLSFELEPICLQMMAREIDDRYASMEQVADVLGSFLKQTRADQAGIRESAELSAFDVIDEEYQFVGSRRAAKTKLHWPAPGRKFWIRTAATGVIVALCLWLAFAVSSSWPGSGEEGTLLPPAIAPFDETQAKQHQQAWADHLRIATETTNSIGMKLTLLPPGEFTMGSPASEAGRRDDEPQHQVKITKPFYLGVHEVTQQQYEKVMGTRPWQGKTFVKEGPDFSATWVSHDDAVAFCRKLSNQEGVQYRLPTEAEWEYACRAGTTTAYSFGNDASKLGQYAWYRENAWDVGEKYAHRVGQKLSNPWGLYDMHGNVWEWCQDWHASYGSAKVVSDPKGPAQGNSRSLRGGDGFDDPRSGVRSAVRNGALPPISRLFTVGFRVARTYNLSPAVKPPAEKTVGSKPPSAAIAPFDASQAKQHQQAWADHLGTPVETTNSIGMKLKLLPSGTFTMGEGGGTHKVTLTKPFELGVYEVTQEQYEQVMGSKPSTFKGPQNPVEQVSWDDAVEFCRKLSELAEEKSAGYVYRLPTEAEWEYACRAGTTTAYSFGDSESELGAYAWYKKNSGGTTHPVGGKKPNGWGLYDMHGNVYEWCQDWYGSYPSGSVTDPTGAASGSDRVFRGGSWFSFSVNYRSAFRYGHTPDNRHFNHGFRVLRSSIK